MQSLPRRRNGQSRGPELPARRRLRSADLYAPSQEPKGEGRKHSFFLQGSCGLPLHARPKELQQLQMAGSHGPSRHWKSPQRGEWERTGGASYTGGTGGAEDKDATGKEKEEKKEKGKEARTSEGKPRKQTAQAAPGTPPSSYCYPELNLQMATAGLLCLPTEWAWSPSQGFPPQPQLQVITTRGVIKTHALLSCSSWMKLVWGGGW